MWRPLAANSSSGSGRCERSKELKLRFLHSRNKQLEAQRLEQRTRYDMEMLREVGFCHGIENYSRHLSGRRFHAIHNPKPELL